MEAWNQSAPAARLLECSENGLHSGGSGEDADGAVAASGGDAEEVSGLELLLHVVPEDRAALAAVGSFGLRGAGLVEVGVVEAGVEFAYEVDDAP
jgi:hypothetical protein